MCGFACELRVGELADVKAVARMAATMDDRGPDCSGTWASGSLVLSFRRLKIIDLSEHGSQPMTDPELGLTITFNGCIYNYPELRKELSREGYYFFSISDTEVLLKGYHCWGESFVERLKGMFAFCIAERDTGRVILGRDRLAVSSHCTSLNRAEFYASPRPSRRASPGAAWIPPSTPWRCTTT